jgi:hypothetical protein
MTLKGWQREKEKFHTERIHIHSTRCNKYYRWYWIYSSRALFDKSFFLPVSIPDDYRESLNYIFRSGVVLWMEST